MSERRDVVLSELLKVEDVNTHMRAKFSRICAYFSLLNVEQEKQAIFYDLGTRHNS